MYPSIVSDLTAICLGPHPTFPSALPACGQMKTLRVTMRGGFSFTAPPEAQIVSASGVQLRVGDLRTGMLMWSPQSRTLPARTEIPYDLMKANNRGVLTRVTGTFHVTRDQAELLGWLVGGGTISSEKQSIRFAGSDVWVLKHVERLAVAAFPGIRVKWYAKNAGFDITLTAGINNPLREYLRVMQIENSFPVMVGRFHKENLDAFLQGLWGADGWCCVRKGGNDVELGLTRTDDEGYTSIVRDTHATIGMYGLRRNAATKEAPNRHRLIFAGYPNYRVFSDRVKQIRNNRIKLPPIKRLPDGKESRIDSHGNSWYKTPVQRILRMKDPVLCREVASARGCSSPD